MLQSLELNRAFYHECVSAVLREHCPGISSRHAGALIGWGSEVLGNDDERSKRYGWGPRVVLFLRPKDYMRWRNKLYQVLHTHTPLVFKGYPTRVTDPTSGPPQPIESPDGFLQIPITTCERFVDLYLGVPNVDTSRLPLSSREWLLIPEGGLLLLTAGEVYYDGVGDLTALRQYFAYLPDDVWRYKLRYQWKLLDWDISLIGLCASRGDTLSARFAIARSVERLAGLVFLLNRVYKPGYVKWIHRQLYKLADLADEIGPVLENAMMVTDCMDAVALLYPVLNRLIEYQHERVGTSSINCKQSTELGQSPFAFDLQPVIDALGESLQGELRELSFQIGAVDQWLLDQMLLLNPGQLKPLGEIYDWDDPGRVLFDRNDFEHFL